VRRFSRSMGIVRVWLGFKGKSPQMLKSSLTMATLAAEHITKLNCEASPRNFYHVGLEHGL